MPLQTYGFAPRAIRQAASNATSAHGMRPTAGCGQALGWLIRIMLPDGSRKAQSLTPYA